MVAWIDGVSLYDSGQASLLAGWLQYPDWQCSLGGFCRSSKQLRERLMPLISQPFEALPAANAL
jgi:hypothetical protein